MNLSPERSAGGALLLVGAGAFGALAWALHRLAALGRGWDAGDFVVLGVLAAFGFFCAVLGWQLLRAGGTGVSPAAASAAPSSAKRVTASHGCAAVGVLLLMLSVLVPASWYPVAFLFTGLALLAVSHALTPCVERLEQLRKARASLRQL